MNERTFTLPSGEAIPVFQNTLYNIVETALLPVKQLIGLVDNEHYQDSQVLDLVDLMKILLEKAEKQVEERFMEIERRTGRIRAIYACSFQDVVPAGELLDAKVEHFQDIKEDEKA